MSRVLPYNAKQWEIPLLLDGRKTVTRRVVKFLPGKNPNWTGYIKDGLVLYNGTNEPCNKPCQYQPGDILYVRETWSDHYVPDEEGEPKLEYCYKADGIDLKGECLPGENNRWYPSIHMPKEAARIWLKVTDVRVERLQEINEEQAEKEGIKGYSKDGKLYKYAVTDDWWIDYHSKHRRLFTGSWWQDMPRTAKEVFFYLWNSTLKKSDLDRYGWDVSPWVWVIEFERCEKPEPCILKGMEPFEDKRPCIGYGDAWADEPCEMCKKCEHCTGNEQEGGSNE